ncbi:MAG: hypothetical protein K2O02_04590 [Lachnospiraceae bacterium]|nr:hypothetical protein [Lachnospiraceae bacterium]
MNQTIQTSSIHKIGRTTYHVFSAAGTRKTENLEKKIERLIKKEIRETAEKQRFSAEL